jgi:GH25 family lysozyme M1 (1,4-beta-N-acetylmuramidase)
MAIVITQNRLNELNCVAGIDVSHIQANIDWAAMKQAGIEFAFIKLTEGHTGAGSYEGDTYNTRFRVIEALKNQIKIGYYHFARPGNINPPEQDAFLEVQNIITHLKNEVYPRPHFPIVLDLEGYSGTMAWPAEQGTPAPSKSQLLRFVNSFISEMAENGYETMIYSNPSFINEKLPSDHSLGNYSLWIANYVNDPNSSLPVIPDGWTQWVAWQYSDSGNIGGINPLDVDIMKKSFFDKY